MKKPMKIMIISLIVVFGGVFSFKIFQGYMIKKYLASMKQVPTVSTMLAEYQDWQPKLQTAGSIRAIRGVDVTTELAGLVTKLYFTPGSKVLAGTVLVQLNADSDIAQLHSLQANAALADSVYKRDKSQYAIGAISKATLDTDAATVKSKQALVEQQAAIVAKKTIRAPFTGRLGVCQINPGQYLNAGNKVVSLQSFDPIYVDFYLPQQNLVQLAVGQNISVENNAFPDKIFTGKITTIDPNFDPNTRNVEIEATLANPHEQLLPGMFATVTIHSGQTQKYLTLPQTAITFNPYGSSVYVLKRSSKKSAAPELKVIQSFVTTGPARGDQIAILSGISAGDEIVTSGQMKLKNNMAVHVNNSVQPSNNPAPKVTNE